MKINITADTKACVTALHLAARKGKLEDCKRLYLASSKLEEDNITEAQCPISFDDFTNSQDRWIRTHSGHCFQYSELAVCLESDLKHPINRNYLGKMALANIIPWKQTPIHYAITAKHLSIVEFFLLNHKFTVIEVYQLLQFAAYCSNKAICELLYTAWQKKGGDIPNEAHYTPLMIALMKDQKTSQFLLNKIDYTFATKHRCPEGKSLFCYLTLSPLAWEGDIPHNLRAPLQQNLIALLQQDLSTEDKKLYSRYSRLTMSPKMALRVIGNNIITKDNYSRLGDNVNHALRIELFMAIQQGDINFLNDLTLYQKEFNFNFLVDDKHILEAALNSPKPKAFTIILNYIQRNAQSVQAAFIEKFFTTLLPAAPEKLIKPLEQILELYILINNRITLSKTAELAICNCLTLAAFQGRDRLIEAYLRVNISPKISTKFLQDMSSSAKKLMAYIHQNNKSGFMGIFAELYQKTPSLMTRPVAYITIIRNEQARKWIQELITNCPLDLSSVMYFSLLPSLLDYALCTSDSELFTNSIGFLSQQNREKYMIERLGDALDRRLYSHLNILQKNGCRINNILIGDNSTQAKLPTIIYAFQKQILPLFQICCEDIEKHPISKGVINQLYAMMLNQDLSPAPYMQLLAKVAPLNQVLLKHGHSNLTLLEYGVNHNKDWLIALCLKQEEGLAFSKEQKVSALKSALQLNRPTIARMLVFCAAINPFIDKFLPNNTLGYITLMEYILSSQKTWLKKLLCEYAILQGQATTHLIQDLVRQHVDSLKIDSDGKSYSVLTYAIVHEKDWLFNLCLKCPFSGDTNELSLDALYHATIHGRQQYFKKIIEYFKMDINVFSININTNLSFMEYAIITNKMFLLEHCAQAFNRDNLSDWANCIALALEANDQAALSLITQHINFDTPPKQPVCLGNMIDENQSEMFRTLIKIGYISPNRTVINGDALFLYALNHQKDWLVQECLLERKIPIRSSDLRKGLKHTIKSENAQQIETLLNWSDTETLLDVCVCSSVYPLILGLENADLRSMLLTRILNITNKPSDRKSLFKHKNTFWQKMTDKALSCSSFTLTSLSIRDFICMSGHQLDIVIKRTPPSWKKVIELFISISPIATFKMAIKTIKSYFHTTSKQPVSKPDALLAPSVPAAWAITNRAHKQALKGTSGLTGAL